ncbi:MAG: DUF58 domain-containing protein [Clostridia bacterium]
MKKLEIKYELKFNPLFFVNSNYLICYTNSSQKQQLTETSRTNSKISIFPTKVGESYFGLEYITVRSFMGVFSKQILLNKKNNAKPNCLITPIEKEFKLSPFSFKTENFSGSLSSPKKGNEDFIGVRPYAYGDSLKRINFKKSSALKKSIVNEYDAPISSLFVNIYIEKTNKENYTEVAEAVLAVYNFYKSSNIPDCSVNFWNGQVFDYNEDSKNNLALDLAKFKPELFNKSVEFNYKNGIKAFVVSDYNEKSFNLLSKYIEDGTVVFLTNTALKYKNEIATKINTKKNSSNEIFLLSESDYLN